MIFRIFVAKAKSMDEVAPARQPGKLSDSRLKRFRFNQADNIL